VLTRHANDRQQMNPQIHPFVEEVYEFLKKEITWLHARWIIFEQLYNKSPLRLDLLNESAPSFFHLLQLMLLNGTGVRILRLAR